MQAGKSPFPGWRLWRTRLGRMGIWGKLVALDCGLRKLLLNSPSPITATQEVSSLAGAPCTLGQVLALLIFLVFVGYFIRLYSFIICCCSVAQLCLTLCDPMDCSTPGFPVLHYLPELAQNSCPLSRWCHPTISSSVIPFSSCPQSFPASRSFPMTQLFTSGG